MSPTPITRRGNSSLQRRTTDVGIHVGKWNYLYTLRPQEVALTWTYAKTSPKDFALYFWKVTSGSPHTYILAQDHITTMAPDPNQQAQTIRIDLTKVNGLVPGQHYKPVLAKSGVSPANSTKPPTVIYDEGSLSLVYDPTKSAPGRK